MQYYNEKCDFIRMRVETPITFKLHGTWLCGPVHRLVQYRSTDRDRSEP